MISVVIPTLDAERGLAQTLSALVPAVVDGVVRQVIISDGGSVDRTLAIADDGGADIIHSKPGRGRQLADGARAAKCPWLLFLHADTVLGDGWIKDASRFMEAVDTGKRGAAGASFRFAVDDDGVMPRLLERAVSFRCAVFRLPYGDQGFLIPCSLYDEIGGFQPLPLMEDVDIVRRLGWRRLAFLRTRALTSPDRFRRDGYLLRAGRNLSCLALYKLGAPMELVVRLYAGGNRSKGGQAGCKTKD